jgi:hypothetical protein
MTTADQPGSTHQPQNNLDPVWHMGPPTPAPEPVLNAVDAELQAWDDYWEITRWENTPASRHIPVLSDAAYERLCGYPPGGLKRLAGPQAGTEHEPEAEAEP